MSAKLNLIFEFSSLFQTKTILMIVTPFYLLLILLQCNMNDLLCKESHIIKNVFEFSDTTLL